MLESGAGRPELGRTAAKVDGSREKWWASEVVSCVEASSLSFRKRSAFRREAIIGDSDTVMIRKLELSDGLVRA